MFEKEAEDNKPPYAFCSFNTKCELWKSGFQQGAEFGYNKAFVEADKNLKAIVTELTKAKEIIKDYMTIVKGAHTTVCGVSEENRTINVLKLNEEAEQFLNKE